MNLRDSNIAKLPNRVFDALIIGSGINGAVSAAALSGKGASVALIDQRDFAGFTSQQSSNLAWGGIKYLESGDYGLVRKLCLSRNHLIDSYPSRVQEIRFFTTIDKGFRFSPWFLWIGTWVYWLFGNGYTRIPRFLTKRRIQAEEPVVNTRKAAGGFEYSDAYLHDNDSRFVFQFVRAAMDRGTIAANYVESLGSRREEIAHEELGTEPDQDVVWITEARDTQSGKTFQIRSKILINAAGPFADGLNQRNGEQTAHQHLFSKGIHLIVPQITPQQHILTFFADDGRLFFVIPMGVRTCIGTTDTPVESPFTLVTDEDRDFVLENINKRLELAKPLTRADIIAERCGVRPLVVQRTSNATSDTEEGARDWMQLSRKHAIDVDPARTHLSIFGGKLTDCVNIGNEVAEIATQLGVTLPHPHYRWYGEPHRSVYQEYMHQARLMDLDSYTSPDSIEPLSSRLWRRYDQQAFELLAQIREDPRQAEVLIKGTDYTRCEIQLAKRQEMIVTLEDFLRRRSKIALVVPRQQIQHAEGLMEACEILFGDQAQARYDEYFCQDCGVTAAQSRQTTAVAGPPGASKTNRLVEILTLAARGKAIVSTQNPIILGDLSAPQPDLALLRYREDYYTQAHPAAADILLLAEVADTSLPHDRNTKLPLYARFQIPEVWIIDIRGGHLDIHRTPDAKRYTCQFRITDLSRVEVAALPELVLDCSGLF